MRFTWRWESRDENRLEPQRLGSPPLPSLDMLMGSKGLRDALEKAQGLGPCALRWPLSTYCVQVSQVSPGMKEETGRDPAPKKH